MFSLKYSKSNFSQNTNNLLSIKVATCFDSNDLYSLPNIVRMVKSRRMRWAGHVARMGEDRGGAQGVGGEA